MFRFASFAAVGVLSLAAVLVAGNPNPAAEPKPVELLNVSYDPTRELYRDLNELFAARYGKEHGAKINIKQAHGGSAEQALAAAGGSPEADVVTLAVPSDVELLRQKGLVAAGWERRLPYGASPYYSTIVFVVRKGNPKQIADWVDLAKPGVQIVTPNPKTSGNGQLTFLAAWGAVLQRGQAEKEAREFVQQLYRNVVALDAGARASTVNFVEKKLGDVHITWENEAHRAVKEANGELEIVYPLASIRAEPVVAVVDANVKKHQTQAAAEAYAKFLFSDEAQDVIARHHYRPVSVEARRKHQAGVPIIDLFPVTLVARDWVEAQQKFFAENGIAGQVLKAAGR